MNTISRAGRNDPCPCGSGKKFKVCCVGRLETVEAARRSPWMRIGLAVVGLAVVAGAAWKFGGQEEAGANASNSLPASNVNTPAMPVSFMPQAPPAGGLSQPPPGQAPPGKVWSPEHGHYHDAPAGAGGAINATPQPGTPSTFTPEPPGPAPAGKVWSSEHGHYHDAPTPGAPVPQ